VNSREFLENEEFVQIMKLSITQILSMLLKNGVHFTILTNIARVNFEPKLPSCITQKFQPMVLFELANYTFQSAKITDDFLTFEAGFGEENFASLVAVPFVAILQIAIENTPIFLNASFETKKPVKKEILSKKDGLKSSLEALLSNPDNKKFIKK
jgi:hypothetical protein